MDKEKLVTHPPLHYPMGSPFHWASLSDTTACLETLLQGLKKKRSPQRQCSAYQLVTGFRDEKGRLPIHWAARAGKLENVKYLLGIETEHLVNSTRQTSTFAGSALHRKIPRQLHCTDNEGRSTSLSNYNETKRLLLLTGNTPLLHACTSTQVSVAEYLLSQGASVNHRSRDNFGPLLYASVKGGLDMVKLLVENGAPVDDRHAFHIFLLFCTLRILA